MSSNEEVRRKCSKCNITPGEDENLTFHRFPLPGKHGPLKARVWAKYCFPAEDWSSDESLRQLYQQHNMLCSKHFDDSSFTSSARKRLNKFAIPMEAKHLLTELRQELYGAMSETSISNISVEKVQDIAAPQTIEQLSSCCLSSQIPPAQAQSSHSTQSADTRSAKGILRELDLNKSSELTPRKRKLYNRCRRNLSEIIRLRKNKKIQPRALIQTLMTDDNVTSLLKKNISGPFALLLQSQLKNTQRKLTGRRWTIDEKVMALSIYRRSASCYKLLKRLFCLPSEGTLKRLLNKIPMKCGVNAQIFETIKRITSKRATEDNLCILAFDEMSIRKNLSYNKRQDMIDGYQDHGFQGRTMEPATHALLFMAIGIRKCWKQPLAFYFSGDCVTADRLTVLIKEVLRASFQAGLTITATVCDNFGVNIKALNTLGSTVDHPFFHYNDNEIVTISDPPHLLKCFRNNFMKHDIECTQGFASQPTTGVAKWKYIKEFFEKDNANPNFVFAPALTKQHIEPNFKQKMKVSLACQVLSHSVAAGILAKIANNELSQEAITTALVVEKMDQLFDALNGDTPDLKRGKTFLTNMTQKSPHLQYFKEMKGFFTNLKFIGARTKPPSQVGFVRTLNAVERLHRNLRNKHNVQSLATRRLNQDPLENCFGCIRSNCGSNPNPTTVQFVAALKTSIIGNLLHSSRYKNCSDDNNIILSDLKSFLTEKTTESTVAVDQLTFDVTVDVEAAETVMPQCSGELQACAYVCGFMVKKLAVACTQCKLAMLADQNTEVSHLFSSFKEYDSIRSSLVYVNENFTQTVENVATTVNKYLSEKGCKTDVKNLLTEKLKTLANFEWLLGCSEHFEKNQMHIIVSTISICVKRHCVLQNRHFVEQATKKSVKRKICILKNI